MKKVLFGKALFVILFFASILTYSYLSSRQIIPSVIDKFNEDKELSINNVKPFISGVEDIISEECYARYDLIEAYGEINKIMGKTEINGFEYALDEYGGYNPINFSDEVDNMDYKEVAEQVLAFKNDATEHGAHFIYLQSPNKIDDAWNKGFENVPYEDKNEKADKLIAWMERFGIDVLDLRKTLANSGLSYQEMFYNSDHHWTGVAAFEAFKDIVGHMNEKYNAGLDPDGFYRDINNYSVTTYDKPYLGSAGRNIGFSFGNVKDYMQLVVPTFDGNIKWSGFEGNYKDTVFRYSNLESDNPYEADTYGFYMYGVAKKDVIINNANPDGLRILFVRDSFMSPVIIDMIPFCSEIDCYWGLYVDDAELKDKVENGNYDYVILSYGTLNIEQSSFEFYKQDKSLDK